MRLLALLLPVLQLTSTASAAGNLRPRNYDKREYYAVQLTPGADHELVAQHLGLEYDGPLGKLDDHHLFSGELRKEDVVNDYRKRTVCKRDPGSFDARNVIVFAEKQKTKKLHKRIPPRDRRGPAPAPQAVDPEFEAAAKLEQQQLMKTLDIRDPIFADQWHLMNTVQKGHDINVTALWLEGITGHNATVAIVDDGLDMYSNDLKDNYFAKGSYDFNDHVSEPKPRLSDDRHGTRCAGEIAAVKNDVCGVGVAWDSKVAGIRILSKVISDADEAIALNYAYQENQIYSCSWGPPDDGQSMEAPGILIKKAILKGIQQGRDKKGSVFVFASGNGAASEDNCNFDGYTNSIYSITVGAIDRTGAHPYYSESCSAQMVVTYSSGSGDSIHTTDVGTNQCYNGHGGTSAAAPLAAGIFALVLSARPELTWRDLQYLVLDTAVPVNEFDDDWKKTAIGKPYNHKYGYGKLDAYAIVTAAKTFKQVKPQAWFHSPVLKVDKEIPENSKGLKTVIEITKEDLEKANFARVEHIQVHMNAIHEKRGDMSVDLISPEGIVSHISTVRKLDASRDGYRDWDFMSVKHWGESGIGKWTVVIRDTEKNQLTGSLVDWSITLWGESIDADKAELHPLPLAPGEKPSKTLEAHPLPPPTPDAGSSAAEGSPSIPPIRTTDTPCPTDTATVSGDPSDHTSRPTKPSDVSDATKGSDGEESANGTESQAVTNPGYLPSFLPTFGVSPATQAWIYGSAIVIAGFVATIAFYLIRQKRKDKARGDGMDYEFEALGEDDLEEGQERPRGAAAGGRRKARDLYDAFGASDDESEIFSGSEDSDDMNEKDYYEDQARGVDEGSRTGDKEKLLGKHER